jgi:hypothetical protein
LPYTLLFLNYRWFTFVVPLIRALKVISPSGNWHLEVPHASQRRLLSRSNWRSPLSRSSRRSQQKEEDVIQSQGDSNDPSEYTPLSDPDDSDSEQQPVRVASEFHTYNEESPTVPA